MTGKTDGSIGGLTMNSLMTLALVSVAAVTLAACSGSSSTSSASPVAGSGASAVTVPTQTRNSSGAVAPPTATVPNHEPERRSGMEIRLTVGGTVLRATMLDNATSRDFMSLLPLTLTLRDYAGTEKVSDLPRRLSTDDAPAGVDPALGDIAYYAPWGNLAIFYRDFGYSSGLIKLGSIETGIEDLAAMTSDFTVIIERAD
jgi:hypothetical protein